MQSGNTRGECSAIDDIACVQPWRDLSQPPVYPHQSKETLYFEYPAKNRSITYTWTKDPNRAGQTISISKKYLYMPYVMMHEFGHTAGLGHPNTDVDVMSGTVNHDVKQLTDNDKKAMRSIYSSSDTHH